MAQTGGERCKFRPVEDSLQFTSSDFRNLLQAAPNLEHFEMASHTTDDTASNGEDQVANHTSLVSLSLHLSQLVVESGPFGVQLDVPSLSHVKIISFDYDLPTGIDLPMPSWDQPTTLSLSDLTQQNASNSPALFRKLPNLNTLTLEGRNIEEILGLIISLYESPGPSSALPLLKLGQITLEGTDVLGKTLVKFIEAPLSRIEKGEKEVVAVTGVTLYDNSGVKPRDWKRVNGLLERGRLVMNWDTDE